MNSLHPKKDMPPTPEQTIRRRIVERTGGRVRNLQVEFHDGHLVIGGTTPTYYLKQLAIVAVLEAKLSGSGSCRFNIEVSGSP
jgi:hypothetical protein